MFTYLLFLSVSCAPLNVIGPWNVKSSGKTIRIWSKVQRTASHKLDITDKTEVAYSYSEGIQGDNLKSEGSNCAACSVIY